MDDDRAPITRGLSSRHRTLAALGAVVMDRREGSEGDIEGDMENLQIITNDIHQGDDGVVDRRKSSTDSYTTH